MKVSMRGFTLIEVLVVVALIGVLASVLTISVGPIREEARDTERQADLREVQTALELYKRKHGRYPEACNGTSWSGQIGTNFQCPDVSGQPSNLYIVGNDAEGRPFREFLATLPQDPKLNGNDSGYVYRVNGDGSVYKFMAFRTVENDEQLQLVETSTNQNVLREYFREVYSHPFKSCDRTYDYIRVTGTRKNDLVTAGYAQACDPPMSSVDLRVRCDIGICDRRYDTAIQYNSIVRSSTDGGFGGTDGCVAGSDIFQTSYAVWGGVANVTNDFYLGEVSRQQGRTRVHIERNTEAIVCSIP